jgi:microcystin-dependent protein
MSFLQWSKTAASNASADGSINWAEGQPPASVNDSARAMMARLAEFRDDTSGLLVSGGSSTAYTLTTNQGFASTPNDGQIIAFSPHTTSGVAPTLQCDAGTAYPIQSAPGTAIGAASLVQGTPYLFKFNASQAAYIALGFFGNAFNIPVGGILSYLSTTVPNSNFALPYGQAVSRTTYAALFSLIGTTFGVGDGVTTFNLPDLRGRALFGLDNMGGSAANRITVAGGNFDGTVLGGTGGAQNHTLTTPELPAHSHGITDPGHTHSISNIGTNNSFGPGGATAYLASGTTNTNSATTGISVNNAGSGSAHTILPPAMVVPFILRII